MRDEDGTKKLFAIHAVHLREYEVVERQQDRVFRGDFDSDCASVCVARPALGWFRIHW